MTATYEPLGDGVATITMDDGRLNVLTAEMFAALDAALDEADRAGDVVILRGRPGAFSAGFDLAVLGAGGRAAAHLVRSGFEIAERLVARARPVVVGCTGHAIAMGSFLVLAGDHRVGAAGDYTIRANEVAIGLTMPHAAVEICRRRLTPSAFHRAVLLSETFGPESAVAAGFLDEVVEQASLDDRVCEVARGLVSLDDAAYGGTKQRVHGESLAALRAGIEADHAGLVRMAAGA